MAEEVRISQFVVEYATAPEIEVRISQFIIEYIPAGVVPPVVPPPPGCPAAFPTGTPSDQACPITTISGT